MSDWPFQGRDGPYHPLEGDLERIADALERIATAFEAEPKAVAVGPLYHLHRAAAAKVPTTVPYAEREGVDPLAICGRCHHKSWHAGDIGQPCMNLIHDAVLTDRNCGGTMYHYPQPPLPERQT